ncbi:uncharacterized protein B0T23DRAFT_167630 [Neurospora hispaniola]|uniref:Uncharacterized protein n=1 Tax=Neurospora hispaniola TaxID=588809 RepID=A0AAJ0MQH3_9PEZI|nr:hypothetical protein B0T23DRAFT_167630 [Neurospora hispaniola]
MAVITSMVPTSTAAMIPNGVPISVATPAVITSAAALRRQIGGTDVPILTNICGYAVAEDAHLKSISPPEDMVCAMFPPNRLFGFCSKKSSLKDRHDIVANCGWNAWCVDAYNCSNGCGIAEARAQFGTTRCHAASNPYCQLTRLTNTHTDEADPYWSVGCGDGHYTIHNYMVDQKAALGTSVLATIATTTTATTTTSSGKRNSVSTVAPLTTGDDILTASHVQAPVPTISTAKPVIPTSSSQPPEPPTLQQTPSTNTFLPSPSLSGVIAAPPTLTSTSSTQTLPETQTSDFPTYISSANTPSEEDQNQKRHNPKSAILGSVIGALAVIYLILFTWWYRGPRRRKRAREAKEAAAAALRERGFWRPGAPEHGLYGANRPPHGIQELQGTHGPGEIHELGFGTMTNPHTPTRQRMPNNPQTKTKNGIGDAHGSGNGELPGLSPLSPMVLSTGRGGLQATSASAASTTNMSGVTSTSSTNSGSRCGSGCRACAESGIFGIEKPAKEAVTATIREVAELDGRNVTFEVRDRVRREQLEGIDLALEPVRWKGSGSGGGTGTGTTKGGAFGAAGGSNGAASTPMGAPVARTTLVPPPEWNLV